MIGQFAALVHPLDPVEAFEEIRFTVRADRPRRFSVQVRLPGAGGGARWVRSVYADTPPRLHPVARRSLLAHVLKLQEDGRVSAAGDTWRWLGH